MMKKLILKKMQAGDTIVEVLFCLVVISGSILATYRSINSASSTFQENAEHNWAIKLVDTQTDELYIYARSHPGYSWTPGNCFQYNSSAGTVLPVSGASCLVGPSGQTGGFPTYTVGITFVGQTYTSTASWTGRLGTETVSITYRPPR